MAVYGTYRINYNANSGSGAPSATTGTTVSTITVEGQNYYTANATLSSSKPSRTYYTFKGWSGSPSATSASYSAGGTFSIGTTSASYTTTLYAVWQRNVVYVYYNANGGQGAPATQSHSAGTNVTLSATVPTRSGYQFLGWSTNASATTAQYQPSTSQALYTTTTLYAVWQIQTSTISASNGTLGTAQTITITKQSAGYKDTITYKFGSTTGTIATESTATSISWTPPVTLANQIPNASSGTCTLTTTTYNGSTLLGSNTKTITLSVPSSLAPTGSVALTDTNTVSQGFGVYVLSRSALAVSITASAQYGATIASYSTTINGATYSGASFTTAVLAQSGSNSYTCRITDSRGKQTTLTGSFSVVAYTAPTCQITSLQRDASTTTTLNMVLDYSVGSVNNLNAKNYKIEYKLRSSTSYTTYSTGVLPNYSGTLTLALTGFNTDYEYDLLVTVTDSYSSTYGGGEAEASVGTDNSLLIHASKSHKGGIGILMPSQASNQVDIGKDTVVHGIVDILPHRAFAKPTASGWYRVCEYSANNSGSLTGANGLLVDFNVQRYTNAENHSIELRMTTNSGITFCYERSKSHTQLVDKIRYTTNATTLKGYVDVHLTGGTGGLGVDFNVHASHADFLTTWNSMGLESVADAPSSETIVTTWDFHANGFYPNMAMNLGSNSLAVTGAITTSNGDLSKAGTITSATPSAVTVSASTWKSVASITLSAGRYVIGFTAQFAYSSTGRRRAVVSTSADSSTNVSLMLVDEHKADTDGSSTNTYCKAVDFRTITANTTYYLNCWQNSGSNMSVTGRLYAMRIC